jgi:predicted DCC family thiol-disulfide oxidoreductase YuxK
MKSVTIKLNNQGISMSFWGHVKSSLSLDYRSLALYRMLMGLIIMADVIYRLPDLTSFYTDMGLVPRAIFVNEMATPWSFSLHLANGSLGFIVGMFILHAIFGMMLVLGYKTRWAMLGAWIMTVSIHNRNWLVNNGGDDVLRAILFISIFLPLSKCFSMDAALTEKKEQEQHSAEYFSGWVMAFFFQVFAIYFVSYILKNHSIWRSEFSALFYSSRLDIFATPFGIWLRDFPLLQKLFTAFTIYLEWGGPLLLFFAWIVGRHWWKVRGAVVLMFWALHVGILFTMWIGLFPFICMVMWAAFIPGPFWDRIFQSYRGRGLHLLNIYYDGKCGFCRKGVLILREFFLLKDVGVHAADDFPELHALMLKENSWIVVNQAGERFFHFEAMLELIRHAPLLKGLDRILGLKPLRHFFHRCYCWVASHRSEFSKLTQFLQLRPAQKEITSFKVINNLAGFFILITLIMWNLTTIKEYRIKSPVFERVTRWLHLYQEWNMFAPYPKLDNLWVEVPAVLSDGTEIELLTGETDVYSIKDQKFYRIIPNEHWRKFFLNLSGRDDYARYYGSFLCRQWNDQKIRWKADTTLRKMEIVVYSQPNLPSGERGGITRKSSWKHWCFAEDLQRENPAASK